MCQLIRATRPRVAACCRTIVVRDEVGGRTSVLRRRQHAVRVKVEVEHLGVPVVIHRPRQRVRLRAALEEETVRLRTARSR